MAQPNLPDIRTMIQAGIDPKSKLPSRLKFDNREEVYEGMKRIIRVIDEQNACNRYKWYNLPCDLTSQELERLLYYRGQLIFFYLKDLDQFYFMPYALDGTIDFYGRFNTVHPVPFTSGKDEAKGTVNSQETYLSKLKLNCKYGMVDEEDVDEDMFMNSCVILRDYTNQLSQTIIPRQELNDSLCRQIAEMPAFIQTACIRATGISGVRVNDADQADEVREASKSMYRSALRGETFIPIIGPVEMQELADGSVGKAQEFLLVMQALDNYRLSTYGLENGGLFEKKAHVNEEEAIMGSSTIGLVNQDGLSIRQNFCNIANSIWGTSMWCEISETEAGIDSDGDGAGYDENMEGEHGGIENDNL